MDEDGSRPYNLEKESPLIRWIQEGFTTKPLRSDFRGSENNVFGQRWFCLSDTRHFYYFRRFLGFKKQDPCFFLGRMHHFSSKSPVFGGGKQTPFSKNTVFTTLRFRGRIFSEMIRVSGSEKGVITKGVFSLEESLESLTSLDSLKSLENGRILRYLPQSGRSLESLNSLEFLQNGLF